jgi:hypothetical protein
VQFPVRDAAEDVVAHQPRTIALPRDSEVAIKDHIAIALRVRDSTVVVGLNATMELHNGVPDAMLDALEPNTSIQSAVRRSIVRSMQSVSNNRARKSSARTVDTNCGERSVAVNEVV